jgi:ABC-type amino acid transport substrate-binding protein
MKLPLQLRMLSLLLPLMAALSAGAAQPQVFTFVMQPFPPLTTNGTNKPDGFFPEVLQAVCASIKIECKAEVYPGAGLSP